MTSTHSTHFSRFLKHLNFTEVRSVFETECISQFFACNYIEIALALLAKETRFYFLHHQFPKLVEGISQLVHLLYNLGLGILGDSWGSAFVQSFG